MRVYCAAVCTESVIYMVCVGRINETEAPSFDWIKLAVLEALSPMNCTPTPGGLLPSAPMGLTQIIFPEMGKGSTSSMILTSKNISSPSLNSFFVGTNKPPPAMKGMYDMYSACLSLIAIEITELLGLSVLVFAFMSFMSILYRYLTSATSRGSLKRQLSDSVCDRFEYQQLIHRRGQHLFGVI